MGEVLEMGSLPTSVEWLLQMWKQKETFGVRELRPYLFCIQFLALERVCDNQQIQYFALISKVFLREFLSMFLVNIIYIMCHLTCNHFLQESAICVE